MWKQVKSVTYLVQCHIIRIFISVYFKTTANLLLCCVSQHTYFTSFQVLVRLPEDGGRPP
jgi:hypothetical protein